MDKTLDFVAVDFETLTPNLTSACAVGLVKVMDGVILQKLYTLIKPIPDNRTERNTNVHGISDEMLVNAPTFEEFFPVLKSFINDLPLICHNRGTDINILEQCLEYYGLEGIETYNNICTYELTGKSLVECCETYNIKFENHHDALADAEACAKTYLCCNGKINVDFVGASLKDILRGKSERKYEKETLNPLSEEDVENKDTLFFQKKVVITGVFSAFPVRNEIGEILKRYGADINTGISAKTDIVIIGDGAGPSKMKKIQGLIDDGKEIRLIYEKELISLMDELE